MNSIFLDTSVLIPAFIESHPNHRICSILIKKIVSDKLKGVTSSHAVLEFYSVLTKLPLKPRVLPNTASDIIETNITPHFRIVSLSESEYSSIIAKGSRYNIAGGGVYDLLHCEAAEKAKVKTLLTYNIKDFKNFFFSSLKFMSPEEYMAEIL